MSETSAAADTPRTAYRVLERRSTLATVGILLALAGFAWWSTVRRAGDMGEMVDGFASAGVAMMPFDMDAGIFLLMWTTMMVAMMFPTIAPIVLLHRLVARRRGGGVGSTVAFVLGYLTVWTAVGLVPLAALFAFRYVAQDAQWVAPLGGAVLLAAGVYQFTPWKQACQRACQSPMTFLMTHDFGHGLRGVFRTGLSHGLYCLGCCWGLMAVLVVMGLMNLVWMAVIAVIFLAEKHWRHGPALARVVGTAVALLGVAVLLSPALLGSVA